MHLAERSAIKAAISDGGFSIYPAGKLMLYIRDKLPNDDLTGNFDPVKTVDKIKLIKIDGDKHTRAILEEDLETLCSRLQGLNPDYDLGGTIRRIESDIPKMAKHYFNVDNYKPVHVEVLEYFFEGYSDVFKDADFRAFNIDPTESAQYNVPIGIYFKRSQVCPGFPEHTIMHESIHQFTADTQLNGYTRTYDPWFAEGFADALGQVMLYRATKDFELLRRIKNSLFEIDILDTRAQTYIYENRIASRFIMTAGLPLTKAFFVAKRELAYDFNWSAVANAILRGESALNAMLEGYVKDDKGAVKKQILAWENDFKKDGDFDEDDLKALGYLSMTPLPSTLKPLEYHCARWLINELENNRQNHYVHKKFVDKKYHDDNTLVQISKLSKEDLNKIKTGDETFMIKRTDVPDNLKESADRLGNMFFIVKREFDGEPVYDLFMGDLPSRMETGELRCSID